MDEKYFKILEVDHNISLEKLKSVFRRKVIQFHPDKNNSADAHEKFILIKEAYDKIIIFLSDSHKNEECINQPSYNRQSQEYRYYNYQYKRYYHGVNKTRKQSLADKIAALLLSLFSLALMSSPIINYNDLHSQLSKYIESSIVGFIIGMLLLTFSVLSLKK